MRESKEGPWTTENGGGIALEPTRCGLWGAWTTDHGAAYVGLFYNTVF